MLTCQRCGTKKMYPAKHIGHISLNIYQVWKCAECKRLVFSPIGNLCKLQPYMNQTREFGEKIGTHEVEYTCIRVILEAEPDVERLAEEVRRRL